MVGRDVKFSVDKDDAKPKETILQVEDLVIKSKLSKKNVVNNVSFDVKAGV